MRHVIYAIAAFYGAATMVLALALCRTAAKQQVLAARRAVNKRGVIGKASGTWKQA